MSDLDEDLGMDIRNGRNSDLPLKAGLAKIL
jgi:hypothetical protein